MKKQIISATLAAVLGFSSVLIIPVQANTLDDLQEEKSQIQDERSEVSSQLDEANEKLNDNQAQQQSIQSEIEKIDGAMTDAETKITAKNKEIEDTKVEIETLKAEIVVLTERIEKRNELLKDRARSFQENGSMVSYIDVLMGAKSFEDFIDRVSAVATIVEADQDILAEHKADKDELEAKQTEVEAKLSGLEQMLGELEGLKASLEAKKVEKDQLMASLEREEEEIHAETLALAEQEAILSSQINAMKKAIELEKEQLAELERQRQAAAANQSSGGGGTVAAPPVSDGAFTRPAAGTFTSGFGQRWGKLHAGVDIAARGTVPVVAAASGVVIRSYYSPSYGNCIFIAHSINGQTYTTVYAHLSSRAVGEGQVVTKGQFIGNMGNTGDSQGQHLHFELHRGGWNASKSNAIDPRGIVPI